MKATKSKDEILRSVLYKLQKTTPVNSIGPGSVARSLAEVIVDEIGDLYAALDYNTSMTLISSASGRALDMIGELYGVERKRLGEVATADQLIGSFIFYMDAPHTTDVIIPGGTKVSTDRENFIGREYTYTTINDVIITAGRTRVFAPIRPMFADSTFTAGEGTITYHSFDAPEGVVVRCKNLKTINPMVGYESDQNLRNRIKNEVKRSSGGTAESVRFTGLTVNGVRDVKVKPAAYGLGSAKVLVVLEDARESEEVMPLVEQAIREVAPVGVRTIITQPDYARANIDVIVRVRQDIDSNLSNIETRAKNAIIRYLNSLLPDDTLIFTQLNQAILDASNGIVDISFQTLMINGVEIPRANYRPQDGYQIVPSFVQVTAV